MGSNTPWNVTVRPHPGSSAEEIDSEPDWTRDHGHRVGVRGRDGRLPGLTREEDAGDDEENIVREAESDLEALDQRQHRSSGPLIDFRHVLGKDEVFHLRDPADRSIGWRYVVDTSEDWVKNQEKWPANVKREKEAEQARNEQAHHTNDGVEADSKGKPQDGQHDDEETSWRRQQQQGPGEKHNEAYATDDDRSGDDAEPKSEYDRLLERYSPQEISLLRTLQHEKQYRESLQLNDGKRQSPQHKNRTTIAIDEQDQFTPDNWLPRSDKLIRLTGKHPLNAEADLTALYEGGLITPNELHYVRNHGAVPRLVWELHKLEVEGDGGKKLVLSMNDLKTKFDCINIPVHLACDGNRRKELNMIRKTKGFNFAAAGTGCAYWKGPLLRDVLLAAGVKDPDPEHEKQQRWVNFQGADMLSEGRYETCIPLAYAMNPENDVLLPYEMNDVPLPPDHGYPVRLIIPGYVGGRCVKWLRKIWVSDKENQSHYHIWDNRVLPSFITEKDGEFASTMFHHPDTACNEQNLNSVIVRPQQGEKIPLTKARKGSTYRIQGFAYDGGGHEVQRVEVSLDGGRSWLYCCRRYPEYPIRHGNKFWAWLHWYVDVGITHLVQAKSITVRAWNVFKNTQPEHPSWNIKGMMNNCWYTVKSEIVQEGDDEVPTMLFRHPVEPGSKDGGWMQPSEEMKIASAKQSAGAPQKQFTRQEIEKHDKEKDCWIVVDGKVYDATSVLDWHPGGKAAILQHAGKVHQDTSDEFASIHDDFAYQKLKECALGVVTEKAAQFMKAQAEAVAKEAAQTSKKSSDVVLQRHKWVPVKLVERQRVNDDTRRYIFALPDGMKELGLGTCQHIELGFHFADRLVARSYTPVKPLLPPGSEDGGEKSSSKEVNEIRDGQGTFELVIKTYFPTDDQPGGALSNILDCIPVGEEVEIKGPTGEIVYKGDGEFEIMGKKVTFDRVNLVLGGSGLTPGYALIARTMLVPSEKLEVKVVDANKTEADILLRDELTHLENRSQGRLAVTHVLSHSGKDWKGLKGRVNAKILREHLFPPDKRTACFLCGPPSMIQKAVMPALKDWGFKEDTNIFGF